MDDQKFIDLEPHKWKSDDKREKPHEPFFGPGWPVVIGVALGIASATIAIQSGFGPFTSGMAGVAGGAIGAAISDAFQ